MGLQNSDTVTGRAEAYASANAGTGKILNVTSYTVNDGNAGNNYTVSTVPNNTGVIDKAHATINVTPYNVMFDSNPHTATGTAIGVCNENLNALLNLSGTTHTAKGDYPTDPWTFNSANTNTNYFSESGTVHDSIGSWTITGFYQPVDMNNVVNTIKGGSTVPLKFNIYAGNVERTSVSDVQGGTCQLFETNCSGGPEDPMGDLPNTGATALRYDTTGHQFIQNWQTPKGANHCYTVKMTAIDGSVITAYFKTK